MINIPRTTPKMPDGPIFFILGLLVLLFIFILGFLFWVAPWVLGLMAAVTAASYLAGRILYRIFEGEWKW